jgi:putative phage-type endonuclease
MITEQQRRDRQLGIGGSDMPIILGLSSYKTPYQLYLEKIGESNEIQEESVVQRRGRKLESFVRSEFEEEYKVKVETPDTLIHPTYSFLRANVDGYIPELNAIWEGKTSIPSNFREWQDNDESVIPLRHMVQLAHYCAVSNADKAYISVFFSTIDLRHLIYERNLQIEQKIIEAAKEFWNCVENRIPPEPTKQIDLRLMYPKHNPDKTKTITPIIAQQLTTLTETRFKIKELSEVEDEHKFNIMQFMEDAECLVNESGQLAASWKSNKRGSRTFLLKGVN